MPEVPAAGTAVGRRGAFNELRFGSRAEVLVYLLNFNLKSIFHRRLSEYLLTAYGTSIS